MDDYDLNREYVFVRLREGSFDWAKFTRFEDGSAYLVDADHERIFEERDDAWQRALNWLKSRGFIRRDEAVHRAMISATWEPPLLSHKADIDADDGYGTTALAEAVYTKKLELAKLLLRFDAKVNTSTGIYIDGPAGITPLHEAYWSAELTKLLLEKGADPKAKDSDGKTPLDWARGEPAAGVYKSR